MPSLITLVGACFYPALCVLPFYLWRDLPRNHPKTIYRRMAASVAACSVAWVPTWLTLRPGQVVSKLPSLLGLRSEGLAAAALLPLGLTATLFAGPLYMLYLDWQERGVPLRSQVPSPAPVALRNLLVAPLTEEFLFRCCLVSFLLARGVSPTACIFLSPLAFGAAHLHHLYDLVHFQGWPLQQASRMVLFQLGYTTVFGWYATFLLLRTGSLLSLAAVHSFCNFMGFPAFGRISSYKHPRRVAVAFIGGVAAFAWLLGPLTRPGLYWSAGGDYASLFRAAYQ